jgi:hypothetical protein
MNRDDNQRARQGALWADITAVLSVICVICALYLPLILR